ncbi:uncharacterized protein JCM15063_005498 [Sporobolomyces koalae]|uniref:uncharacterized protein n=1 Tax=Sporobolomyces koalae TaxID=500713 RepID=UPI00317C6111
MSFRATTPYQSEGTSGRFSRQARSQSRNGRSTPLLFPHARPVQAPTSTLDHAFQPQSATSLSLTATSTSTLRPEDQNGQSSTDSDSESIPLSRLEAKRSDALFAPTTALSHHKVQTLDHNFHRDEHRAETGRMRKFKAEMDIAIGVSHLYGESKQDKRTGTARRGGSLLPQVIQHIASDPEATSKGKEPFPLASLNTKELVGGAAGIAGLVGLAGAGWEWYKHHERAQELVRPASAPAASPTTLSKLTMAEFDHERRIALVVSLPPSLPRASTLVSPAPIYISHLTAAQHKTLQHASAALLLRHHERHVFASSGRQAAHHDEIGLVVAWADLELFGVDLKELTKREGVVSKHGIDPHATGFRVPEFLDHLITALKQSDLSVSGILTKSGNVRRVLQIIEALDHADGSDETVLDLAKLDPVTLADLFKGFLGALPHPVLTHHLFGLFVATSYIQHPGLRRRAMHLVICLMPKVNRDVLECVFLFLSWLHKHAHLAIVDGTQLDLTGIADIMAPILLSPKGRQPRPDETKAMIAAVLNLLEDQQILHEIPLELAHLLHIEPPGSPNRSDHDVAAFVKHLFERL